MIVYFVKLLSGEIPSPRVYEDDEVIAINDLSPIAPIHVLIIPKKHTENIVTAPDGTGGSCKENPAGSNKKTWNC